MEFLLLLCGLVVGATIGIIIGLFVGMERMRKAIEQRSVGRLRIDHSDPDEPTSMFTELRCVTPDMIASYKYVIFEVINESYISHE